MALTWREVAAPDFRNSISGVESFFRTLASAFDAARNGINEADASINDRVNKAFAAELLKYQDPAAYEEALRTGALFNGFDKNRLSGESLAAAGARTGSLYNQANSKFSLGKNQYEFNQTKAADANAPLFAEIARRYYNRDEKGANELIAANPDAMKGMGLKDVLSTVKDWQTSNSAGWATATAAQGYDQSGQRFSREQLDWQAQDEADKAYVQIDRDAFDRGDALRIARTSNLSPKAFNLLMSRINSSFPDTGTGGAGSDGYSGGGGGASDFTLGSQQKAVATTLKNSGFSAPVVAGLLGNFHAEGGYGGAQGDGGSASGIAQWRKERRDNFVKMFGVDPHKATVEQQAQFVKWEFDNPAQAGMTVQQRDAILNAKDPAEAARLIDQFYERSSGEHRGKRMNAATTAYSSLGEIYGEIGSANADMERNPNNMATQYIAAARDRRSVDEIAAELDKTHPGLQGMGQGFIREKLLSIISDAANKGKSINAASAGVIAGNSLNSNIFTRNLPTWLGGGNQAGNYFDDGRASALIEEYSNENVERAVAANDTQARLDVGHQAAVAKATAAWDRYNRAKFMNENEGKNINLGPLLAAAQAADQAAAGSQQDRVNRGTFTNRNAPPAQSPVPVQTQAPRPANGYTTLRDARLNKPAPQAPVKSSGGRLLMDPKFPTNWRGW